MRSFVPIRLVLAAAAAAALSFALVPAARAETRTFRPVGAAHGWLTFKPRTLHPRAIRAARLGSGRRWQRVRVRAVRAGVRAGVLRLRAPRWNGSARAAAAARTVLAVTTTCGQADGSYSSLVRATSGLRAYWRLGETSGTVACDFAGTSHGAYAGGYSLGRPGALVGEGDRAAGFSGSGSVRVRSGSALNPTGALTLEAWVRPTSATRSETIVRKDGQYLLRLDRGRLVFRVWTAKGIYELASGSVVQADAFQHVVATFNGSEMRVYHDGKAVASRIARGKLRTTSEPLYLAASAGDYDFLVGTLDELAVYGTALSPDTVSRHHKTGTAGSEPAPAPAPAEPTPSPDSACGWGSLQAGAWPGACWRPYAATSPFNQPLPSAPRLAANSPQIVARLLSFGPLDHLVAGDADTVDDYWHPTYYSQPTDPLFTLHCYEASWGTCSIEGHQIRVPDAARPAAGGDGHLTVVDQATGWEYDLYKVRSKPPGGGTLEFRWGGRLRIDGSGLGDGGTAAEFGNLAGIIRAPELAAGHIDHALFMVATCDSGGYVYPARKAGRSCAALGLPTSDAPPMGARLQLAMTPEQIAALPVPAWKKTVLRAMAEYGVIMGDTGSGAWGIEAESGSTYTSFGAPDQLVTFAQANGWTPYDGRYVGNLRSDVDWARYLRVIDPCVSQRTC